MSRRIKKFVNKNIQSVGFSTIVLFLFLSIAIQGCNGQGAPETLAPPTNMSIALPTNESNEATNVAVVVATLTPTIIPTTTPILEIGSTQINPNDNAEMVYVPAGEFEMGSQTYPDESPIHTVYLDAYWLYTYEVTIAEYRLCVETGACSPPVGSQYYDQDRDNYPVMYVNWHAANAYCDWAGGSLPTEAQWEKAARGPESHEYPFGNLIDYWLANYNQNIGEATEVGSFPEGVSYYGAYDMAGNVWEWVADWHSLEYYSISASENPTGPASGEFRVLRGGSWVNNFIYLRSTTRGWFKPNDSIFNFGFRCVVAP